MLLVGVTVGVGRPWLRRGVYALSMAACVLLGYAAFIPYLPEELPGWAALHVAAAAGACVCVMAALLLLLVWAREWALLKCWVFIVLTSGALFLLGGRVTSALEVFFCLAAGGLLRNLWRNTRNDS